MRTLDEVRAGRVTIEIRADQVDMVRVVEAPALVRGREPGYWADACEKAEGRVRELEQELATAQRAREIETKRANDAEEKVARYAKAHVCTDRCQPNAHVAFEGNSLVAGLETELADALTRIGELDGQLRKALEEQRRRFTEAEVDAAKEGAREDERAAVAHEVHGLENKLARIRHAVLGTELKNEITTYRDSSAAMLMVNALTEVRRITGVTSV